MANALKGEVGFRTSDGQQHVLRFSTNAIIEIEQALDKTVLEVSQMLSDINSLRMGTVRTIFWAGLRDRRVGISLSEAGEIMNDVGFGRALELIGQGFTAAFPTASDSPNPPAPVPVKAEVGTGSGSSGGGVKLDLMTSASGLELREASPIPLVPRMSA